MSESNDEYEKRILNESHDLEQIREVAIGRRRRNPAYDGEIGRTLDLFMSEEDRCDARRRGDLACQVERAMRENLISPEEFFLYRFEALNEHGRHEFVGDIERAILCARIYSSVPRSDVMFSKIGTYEAFKDHFKRDAVLVSPDNGSFELLIADFLARHSSVIVKPDRSSRGNGVFVSRGCDGESLSGLVDQVRRLGPCIIEELIEQSPEMAAFHPESVNTVRCASYLKPSGQLKIVCAVLRMGTGDRVVDNGGAGGICASIDVGTGIVVAEGATETGGRYLLHPDTGVQILGARVPRWEDLLETVEKLSRVIPEQRYVGWDLALTDEGWVLVEANAGGQWEICQMSDRRGLRKVIEETFGRL